MADITPKKGNHVRCGEQKPIRAEDHLAWSLMAQLHNFCILLLFSLQFFLGHIFQSLLVCSHANIWAFLRVRLMSHLFPRIGLNGDFLPRQVSASAVGNIGRGWWAIFAVDGGQYWPWMVDNIGRGWWAIFAVDVGQYWPRMVGNIGHGWWWAILGMDGIGDSCHVARCRSARANPSLRRLLLTWRILAMEIAALMDNIILPLRKTNSKFE